MNLPPLDPSEFALFFEVVQEEGKAPFPWQRRLADHVFEKGWPAALDVPTGAGKTAAIDIALFHLALEADRGSARRAAMRIVFVVDRRLVVDDAYKRAEKLRRALEAQAPSSVVQRVATRLAHLSGGCPLMTVRLRGGAPRDPDWARSPCQPVIVVSTVDQVGSRLLFRGYGVSDSMKPVHAGLLGADALFLLDEAHLSQPFVQTVKNSVERGEAGWKALREPLSIVTLSATQLDDAPVLVCDDDKHHEVLGRRLTCSKRTELVDVKGSPDGDAYREALVARAWQCSELGGGSAKLVAIVVNRVGRARLIFEAIRKRISDLGERASAALLIGRARPLDRDQILDQIGDRISAGAVRSLDDAALFVVGTQCMEAGADLDFDALVTEVAPLDCLRQRFGRLNRMGRPIEAQGFVVAASEQVGSRSEDPIYGKSLVETWALLREKAGRVGKEKAPVLDFGVEGSSAWLPDRFQLVRFVAPRRDAPVLLPAFIEQWSCTSPLPGVDPEVALFLHGPDTGPGDVEIVWRADVPLLSELTDEGAHERWIARLAACPPSPLEALSVPIFEARRWLAGEARGNVPDIEVGEREESRLARSPRDVFRWRGAESEETRVAGARELRPGDLIVVPAVYGGCDRWGWNPESHERVRDIGSEANLRHRGRDVLRLSPSFVEAELDLDVAIAAEDAERRKRAGRLRDRIAELREELCTLRDASDLEVRATIATLRGMPASFEAWWSRRHGGPSVVRDKHGEPVALVHKVAKVHEPSLDVAATEDEAGSKGHQRVSLRQHSGDVQSFAERFARSAGLPEQRVRDVALAGFLHDAGKARIEFKQWLYGGDELAAIAGEDLAKSGRRYLPLAARERAGLPVGARHEVASLGFARAHPSLGEANDRDLVLWLVGTHHGHGRPFFPPVEWPPPGSEFETDLGDGQRSSLPAPSLAEFTAWWLDLRDKLEKKYGPWGLARLEAVLRLADHRASQVEQPEDT